MTEEQKRARADRCRQMGTLGGQRTAQIYGRKYMQAIGKEGLRTYAERYHSGNLKEAWEAIKLLHSGVR